MARTILFSPVGGTDPMPEKNYKDGSMIHITRVYNVDKVILYMSKEMLDNENKDKRYTYCIEQLAKHQNRKIDYEIIGRPNLTKVQEYDYFYDDFREILKDIIKDMYKEDELLLNVSSGTPAMKSGLLVLNHLWEDNCKSIQVSTPLKRMNEHIHSKEYDVETRWGLNEDNEENYENRCMEVKCTSLIKLKNEELIKKLVREYDYDAALTIAEEIKNSNKNYIDYLKIAKHRLLLDFKEVDKIINKLNIKEKSYNPIKNAIDRKYFEYVSTLDIKLEKLQYADFIRAISPIIEDIFERIIEKQIGINVKSDLCNEIKLKDKTIYKWSKNKLKINEQTERAKKIIYIDDILNRCNNFSYDDFIYSSQLELIILTIVQDKDIRDTVEKLRNVEQNIRNLTAHEIISVTDDFIFKKTDLTSKQIVNAIKKALGYCGVNISKDDYESYQYMNEDIISRIN